MDDELARERVARVEQLLDEVESLSDPGARAKATELVQALLDLYGEGLARVLGHAGEAGGEGLPRALAGDELVSHLLLLHDLHPVPLDERVRGALEEVRPYLESHGGDVELLGVEAGVARLRMQGSCDGCPSSAVTLKLAIEDAIRKAAPEIEDVQAETAAEDELPTASDEGRPKLIPLPMAGSPGNGSDEAGQNGGGSPHVPQAAWSTAGALPELAGGGIALKRVSGEELLFVKVGETAYAYRPDCRSCGASLAEGVLAGSTLTCAACGSRFDVRRAGRSLDAAGVSLTPVPLLVSDSGLVKVALGTVAAA